MAKEKKCPLIKDSCMEHECHFYIQLLGKHPQTGQDVHEYGCAIGWLPFLLIENSKEVRQGAAATENFRNVMFRLASGEKPSEIAKYDFKLLNGGV